MSYITQDRLRAFVRLDCTVDELYEDADEYQFEDCYLTWDDIEKLVRNLKEKDPKAGALMDSWASVFLWNPDIRDHVRFLDPDAYRVFLEMEDLDEDWNDAPYPDEEVQIDLMRIVLGSLLRCAVELPREKKGFADYDLMLNDIALIREKRYAEICRENWNDATRLALFENLDDPEFKRNATPEERGRWRGIIEEMCEKNDARAIETKAYCCYGGDLLYSCDWKTSRDCLLQLMEHPDTDDEDRGRFANTLGYIYYYGRCNDGVPQYEEAAKYYSLGAACGYYESCYKMADLYMNGHGVIKNEMAAMNLVSWVYGETRKRFLHGEYGTNLADAALRMGRMYRDGIGVDQDLSQAYGYFCVAHEAIIRRREEYPDYIGDETVMHGILSCLQDCLEQLPQVRKRQKVHTDYPAMLYAAVDDGYTAVFKLRELKNGVSITAYRIPKEGEEEPQDIMMAFPDEGQCIVQDHVVQHIRDVHIVEVMTGSNEFKANRISKHDVSWGTVYFLKRDDDIVAVIDAGKYESRLENRLPAGMKYRVATVTFYDGGKPFDYLCGDLDVHVADRVIVEGKEGEKEVRVVAVQELAECELPEPPQAYRKVKRIL